MIYPAVRRPHRLPGRARVRLGAAGLLAAGIVALGAGQASAHVSVDAGGAGQGADDVLLTFRVPNERTGASTVIVDIKFPSRTPIGSVKPEAKPGWTVTTTRTTLATPIKTVDGEITKGVTQVAFKAQSPATGIQEDTFETFRMLVGPLPTGTSTLAFPTVQTYSNGQVSSWIEPAIAGAEPAHPAPVLALGPPSADRGSAAGGVTAPGASEPSGTVPTREQVRTATFVGAVGVVTGAVGLIVAGVAVGRTRRRPDSST
jgi:uncharacterized protein YcnI